MMQLVCTILLIDATCIGIFAVVRAILAARRRLPSVEDPTSIFEDPEEVYGLLERRTPDQQNIIFLSKYLRRG